MSNSTSTTKYGRIVDQIRIVIVKNVEGQFKIGELVDRALDAGGNLTRLADDVGVSRSSLNSYHNVYVFWGSDRIPKGKDGRLVPFGVYHHIQGEAYRMTNDTEASDLKARMVAGGRDAYDAWMRESNLARAEDRGYYKDRDPHQNLFDSLRQARYQMATAESDDSPPLTASDRRKVRDLLLVMIADAAGMGILVNAAPSRRVRAA